MTNLFMVHSLDIFNQWRIMHNMNKIYSVLFIDNNKPIKGFYVFAENEDEAKSLVLAQIADTPDRVLANYEMNVTETK